MSLAPPRPQSESFTYATRTAFPRVVTELQEMFGSRLVAYIAGVSETRRLRDWASGSRQPRGDVQDRLRLALQIAHMIAERDGAEVARAWFVGLNPYLDDESPAWLLREKNLQESGRLVLSA